MTTPQKAATDTTVHINCSSAECITGSLARSSRWIIARPSPFSSRTSGRISGSAYGNFQRTTACAAPPMTIRIAAAHGHSGGRSPSVLRWTSR